MPGRRQINGGGRAGYAGEYEDGPDVEVGLSLIMLDDIPVCGVASEVYNPIAVELKQKSPYARTMMTTVVPMYLDSSWLWPHWHSPSI